MLKGMCKEDLWLFGVGGVCLWVVTAIAVHYGYMPTFATNEHGMSLAFQPIPKTPALESEPTNNSYYSEDER